MSGVDDLEPGAFRIDTREAQGHPTLSNELRVLAYKADVRVVNDLIMVYGDYGFKAPPLDGVCPTIGIELSTVSDLCGKVDSGRLAYQLSGLLKEFTVPHLMIETPIVRAKDGKAGAPPGYQGYGVDYDRLWSILYAAQCHGVRVVFCANRESVAQRIWSIYKFWMRPYDDHKLFRTPNEEAPKARVSLPMGKALDTRVTFLMGLPGIGADKATAAVTTAKSIANFMDMTPEMLAALPGWGRVTATRVREFIDARV